MLRDKFVNSILKERQPSLVAYSTFPIAILHFRFVELVIDRSFDQLYTGRLVLHKFEYLGTLSFKIAD